MASIALIGVDWGSTNLRAFAIDETGTILGRKECRIGATLDARGRHASILDELLAEWRKPATPIVVCGMAGARDGWIEIPYVGCSANASSLRAGLLEVASNIWIVPGVKVESGDVLIDVMRGEETQAIGANLINPEGIVICPGTHSKWVRMEGDKIASLRTYMTGELFEMLRRHWAPDAAETATNDSAFDRGLETAWEKPLISSLFSLRIGKISGRLAESEVADYLSGLVIGAEIAATDFAAAMPYRIVGAQGLTSRYARALAIRGAKKVAQLDAAECVAKGLLAIWNPKP